MWTRQFGSSGSDYGRDLVIDSDDNIFVTGETDSTFHEANPNKGNYDVFLVKYNSDGYLQRRYQSSKNKLDISS